MSKSVDVEKNASVDEVVIGQSKDDAQAKLLFTLMGCGFMLPWNAILTTMFEFGTYVMPDEGKNSNYSWDYASPFYSSGCCIILVLLFAIGHKLSQSLKIVGGYSTLAAAAALLLMSALFFAGQTSAWFIGLLSVFCVGVFGGCTQGAVIGLAGATGNAANPTATMVGVAYSGLIALSIQILLKIFLPFPADATYEEAQAHFQLCFTVYSIAAILFVSSCIFIFIYAKKNNASIQTAIKNTQVAAPEDENNTEDPAAAAVESAEEPLMADSEDETALPSRGLLAVTKDSLPMAITIFITFTAVFTVFPAITLALKPNGNLVPINDPSSWFPVCLIGAFQIFDTVGRLIAEKGLVVPKSILPWICVAKMIVFVPFTTSAVNAGEDSFLAHDAWKIFVVALNGLICGWTCAQGFMYAPSYVKRASERGQQGFLLSFCLLFGITVGSSLGPVLKNIFIDNGEEAAAMLMMF